MREKRGRSEQERKEETSREEGRDLVHLDGTPLQVRHVGKGYIRRNEINSHWPDTSAENVMLSSCSTELTVTEREYKRVKAMILVAVHAVDLSGLQLLLVPALDEDIDAIEEHAGKVALLFASSNRQLEVE